MHSLKHRVQGSNLNKIDLVLHQFGNQFCSALNYDIPRPYGSAKCGS